MNLEEAIAIEHFTLGVTLPIIYEQGDNSVLIGTSTLFSILDRYFVVTASHLFEPPVSLENVGFPDNPRRGSLYTFGKCQCYRFEDKIFDIAVVEILEQESIQRLKKGWHFLSINNVAAPSLTGKFFLAGYPISLSNKDNGWLKGRLITAYTQRIREIPNEAEKPVYSDLDLFFHYDDSTTTLGGKKLETPELPGTSGASVWQVVNDSKTELWSPEATIKVIGVQSSYMRSRYFRAKNWWAVAKAFRLIDDDISSYIEAFLK